MISTSELFSEQRLISLSNNTNLGKYSVIWLDTKMNTPTYMDTKKKLRLSINDLVTFSKLDKCTEYIRSVAPRQRLIVIVNDELSQSLIPEIHDFPSVFSIYIYIENDKCQRQWNGRYTKIKAIYEEFDCVMNIIHSDESRRINDQHNESIIISIGSSNNSYEQSITELNGQFVQSQLLIASLLKMKTTPTDKTDFILKCQQLYMNHKQDLRIIHEFKENYAQEFSLWWYTRETFLYRLLNKALRVQDIDLLFYFGFYIRDLETELRKRQYLSPIHVYRAQLMSIEEISSLKNSKDKFISMNSFLSTTRNIDVALMYLGSSTNNDDKLQRVLFEIYADPHQESVKPFADISRISIFQQEEEILMMLGSVFHLNNVYCDNSKIWHIEMNLCSDNQCELQSIFCRLTNQYSSDNSKLLLFGSVLIDMANFEYAEKYLYRLLKHLSCKHADTYKCYHALGKVSFEQGKYELSLNYFFRSLKILRKTISNHSRMGYIYNNIGEVYQKMGKIKEAKQFYEKALNIFMKIFKEDDESIAWCYNNLGIIALEDRQFFTASQYLTKALDIKKRVLPDGHPCLGNTYNNLGNIHYNRCEYDQALEKYKLSYEIFKKSLTYRHPSITKTLMNMGIVYETEKDFIKAKEHYEKALYICRQIFESQHPDLIEIKKCIERLVT